MAFNPKKKHASLQDVASYVGVSTSLASFVLNGKGHLHRVSEEMIDKINSAAKELNYQPNIFAKSLREGKSRVIGVVLSDISNPFFSSLARCLEDEAEMKGYSIFFSSSDENHSRAENQISRLLSRGVDGLVFVPCENSESTVRAVLSTGKPIVLLDRYFPEIHCNYVSLNNKEVSRSAVLELLNNGFSHPGIIAYDTSLQHMRDRIAGYESAMKDSGKESEISVISIKESSLRSSMPEVLERFIESGVDSVLFATNNITTVALMCIKERGICVPDKLGVIGFDGGQAFELFNVPISYIEQPIALMAKKVIEIIMDEINHGSRMIHQIEMQGDIIVSQSSRRII